MVYENLSKEIMFLNTEGFSRIIWNLEMEIVVYWTNGDLKGAYERIKQLFIHVCSHLKGVNIEDFMLKFLEIKKILYNPSNSKMDRMSVVKREKRLSDADGLMTEIYILVKRKMKESGLEAHYGVTSEVMQNFRRENNIKKIFGK